MYGASTPLTPLIVGLVGKKRSGKDTVFKTLKGLIPEATRVALADPLKVEVAQAAGVSVDFVEANKKNFRLILQGWGTDFRRALFGDSYWLDRCAEQISGLSAKGHRLIVITDCRFQNEVDFVRRQGGVVWRVERPGSWLDRLKAFFAWEHASEKDCNRIRVDRVIPNNGTFLDLHFKVRDAVLSEPKLSSFYGK